MEKLSASAERFAETLPPIEALPAWMLLFTEHIASKRIVAPVLKTYTGLITTLVAAFFGIQQAGAGRSQAMTALAQLRGPGPDGAGVSKLEPAHGPHSGGTKVSITGNGFTGASAVNFGATPGTDFKFENDGLVTVNSPPAPPKVDEVKVSTLAVRECTPDRRVAMSRAAGF